jgi:glycosyltransferase involved in cell wall biosynthesis
MVKIAVDCRMLNMSGIGVYLKNILFYWLQSKNTNLVLIGKKNDLIKLNLNNNCQIINCTIPIFSFKEFLNFPTSEINKCDYFYSPNYNIPSGIKIPIFITIHDVVFLDIKDLSNRVGLLIRKYILKRAIRLADKVFTVSEFSKQRIIFHLGNTKEIIVAYNGLRVDLLQYNSSNSIKKYDFEYVLFIGNIKKHKGLDVLLNAIKNTEIKIVIIGSFQNFKTSDKIILEKLRLNKNIIVEGFIDNDNQLYDIISNAKVLVQPSRYEGFGIPPLESLFLGTPVIISDIPVFKEIYSNFPLIFFKDGDSEDLKSKLELNIFPKINKEYISGFYKYEKTAQIIFELFS